MNVATTVTTATLPPVRCLFMLSSSYTPSCGCPPGNRSPSFHASFQSCRAALRKMMAEDRGAEELEAALESLHVARGGKKKRARDVAAVLAGVPGAESAFAIPTEDEDYEEVDDDDDGGGLWWYETWGADSGKVTIPYRGETACCACDEFYSVCALPVPADAEDFVYAVICTWEGGEGFSGEGDDTVVVLYATEEEANADENIKDDDNDEDDEGGDDEGMSTRDHYEVRKIDLDWERRNRRYAVLASLACLRSELYARQAKMNARQADGKGEEEAVGKEQQTDGCYKGGALAFDMIHSDDLWRHILEFV